ncbi:MAG: CoA transferase subunit A [Solirubrobacterales bacterium]
MSGKFVYNEKAIENLRIEDTSILDRMIDHHGFREVALKKSRKKEDKRMSLQDAIAKYVQDGDICTDAGFAYVRTPIQAYFELIRQGKKDLQFIGSPNTNQSYMMFAGTAKYSHNSYVGAEMRGTDRLYVRNIKQGRGKVLSEWGHGSMGQGFKAAQYGLPFVASKQLLGSEMLDYNPFVKVDKDPWTGEPVCLIPALHPDVTIIHCQQADMYGNAKIFGPAVNDIALAHASRKVIITCEEVVPELAIRFDPAYTVIPYVVVDAVVELPYGCLPGACPGYYYWSREWWEWAFRIGMKSDAHFKDFMDNWVWGTKDHWEFLDKLQSCYGGMQYLHRLKQMQLAEEYKIEDKDFDYSYEQVIPQGE